MVHGWINIIHKNEKKEENKDLTSQNWNDSSISIWMIAKSKEIEAVCRGLLIKEAWKGLQLHERIRVSNTCHPWAACHR